AAFKGEEVVEDGELGGIERMSPVPKECHAVNDLADPPLEFLTKRMCCELVELRQLRSPLCGEAGF
ncbi:MAG: hypothetical protein AB1345_14920, partial [Chloroflexota bacterium]